MPTPAKPGGAALELALDQEFALDWRLHMARTLLDATYRSDMCGKAVCTPAQTIPAGNHLPGIARNMGYASAGLCAAGRLACRRGAALHERHSGQRRQQRAGPAYTVAGVNAGYRFTEPLGAGRVQPGR